MGFLGPSHNSDICAWRGCVIDLVNEVMEGRARREGSEVEGVGE